MARPRRWQSPKRLRNAAGPVARHRAELARGGDLERGDSVLCRPQSQRQGVPRFGDAALRQLLRPPRHHLRPARDIGRVAARAPRRVVGCRSIRCCSAWRRAATSRPTRSKCMSTKRSILRRCARNWRWPDMRRSRRSWRMASSRSAARSSMSFPWARIRPTASTCWIATSTAFGASIPTRQRSLDKLDRIQLAAGARNAVEPGSGARVPAPLPAALHRGSVRAGGLPRRQRRRGARRHRILPAVVLRAHLAFVRVFAAATACWWTINDAASSAPELWSGIVERHEQLRHDRYRPILDPAEVYLPPDEFLRGVVARGPRFNCTPLNGLPRPQGRLQNFPSAAPAAVRIDAARRTARRGIGGAYRCQPPRVSCWRPNPPAAANSFWICCAPAAFSRRSSIALPLSRRAD